MAQKLSTRRVPSCCTVMLAAWLDVSTRSALYVPPCRMPSSSACTALTSAARALLTDTTGTVGIERANLTAQNTAQYSTAAHGQQRSSRARSRRATAGRRRQEGGQVGRLAEADLLPIIGSAGDTSFAEG